MGVTGVSENIENVTEKNVEVIAEEAETEKNDEFKSEEPEAEKNEVEIIKDVEDVEGNGSKTNLVSQPKVRTVDDVITDIKEVMNFPTIINSINTSQTTIKGGLRKTGRKSMARSKISIQSVRLSQMNLIGIGLKKSKPSVLDAIESKSYRNRTKSEVQMDRAKAVVSKNIFKRLKEKRRNQRSKMELSDASSEGTKANNVLLAFMAFWNPQKRRRDFLIPKDRAAWLEFLVHVVHKKIRITYLSDKELKKVIIRTRPKLVPRKQVLLEDPECPECFYWNENEVADWVESVGFPNLRESFLLNCINGRRIVTVDVNALRQMGMRYFDEMKTLAGKIREILGLPRPNILRAIMRMVPYEMYLKKKVHNGKTYDLLTFEKFCKDEHFDYDRLKNNKNAAIPGTTEVIMVPNGDDNESDLDKQGSDDEDVSLLNAPTVEFVVRNSILRNKVVTKIIEDILKSALVGPGRKLYGKGLKETMKDGLEWGFSEMGLEEKSKAKERLEFATSVATALLREIQITSLVLEDLEQVEKYVGEKVEPEKLEYLKQCAEQFMEEVVPLAGVVAFGELDLETIFRDTTGMEEYIEEVIDEAQVRVQTDENEAKLFIREVCDEAISMAHKLNLGYDLPITATDLVTEILEEILSNAFIIEVANRRDKAAHRREQNHDGQNEDKQPGPSQQTPESMKQEAIGIIQMVREEFQLPGPSLSLGLMLELMEQLFTTTNIFSEEISKTDSQVAIQHEKIKLVEGQEGNIVPAGQNQDQHIKSLPEPPLTIDQIATKDSLLQEVIQIVERLRRDSNVTISVNSVKELVLKTIETLLNDSNTEDAVKSIEAAKVFMSEIKSKINEKLEKIEDDSESEFWNPEATQSSNRILQKTNVHMKDSSIQWPLPEDGQSEPDPRRLSHNDEFQQDKSPQSQHGEDTLHQDSHQKDTSNKRPLPTDEQSEPHPRRLSHNDEYQQDKVHT